MLKIYLMGGSGCGKSTLAQKLERFRPLEYHNVLESTTRKPREKEIDGVDYRFLTDEQYNKEKGEYFQSVEYQFLPARYGASDKELQPDKANLIVACLEGFLSGMKRSKENDINVLVNIINDDVLDIQREGRDPKQEENVNLSVINQFKTTDGLLKIFDRYCDYVEIKLSFLKTIRNDEDKLVEYFNEIVFETYQ